MPSIGSRLRPASHRPMPTNFHRGRHNHGNYTPLGQDLDDIYVDEDLPIEIPDDDDVEIVHESPVIASTRIFRHRSVSTLHEAFGPSVSPDWASASRDPKADVAVGDLLLLKDLECFMQIRAILVNRSAPNIVVMRGIRLVHSRKQLPQCECPVKELTMLQDIFTDSSAGPDGLFLENFTLQDLALHGSKHKVVFSNVPSVYTSMLTASDPVDHLICRTKYLAFYNDVPRARAQKKTQEVWQNVSRREADSAHAVSEWHLRQQHRPDNDRRRHYTAWDLCSGAGFASEGAKNAGFSVVIACDNDLNAVKSYRLNNPTTLTWHMELAKVIARCSTWERPDLIMISPPCQFYSPVHTVPGQNDEANEAVMFGIADLVRQARPRTVVIEQTFGLAVKEQFAQHLATFIAGLRDNGYSVRKEVLNFADFGEASKRRRLIIIAAAPGEELPEFPEQVFNRDFRSCDPALAPAVSIWDRLQLKVDGHPDHNPYLGQVAARVPAQPYNPQKQKLHTVLCSNGHGVTNFHYSGKRYWTPHELSLLQGAGPRFRTYPRTLTLKRRQIGNAFPSLAAEAIYRQVYESLRRTDERTARIERRALSIGLGSSPQAPIWL